MFGFSSHSMAADRRYGILSVFVMSAIITEPDVVSQFILAVPSVLLYELAILAVRYRENRRPG